MGGWSFHHPSGGPPPPFRYRYTGEESAGADLLPSALARGRGTMRSMVEGARRIGSYCSWQTLDEGYRIGHGAEHAALHRHHLDRGRVVALVGRAAAVLNEKAFEAAVVGLAHGRVDADIGGDAGQHQVVDPARAQDEFEVGGAERALAGLVDDRLAGQRLQFVDDLPPRLAADEDLSAGSVVTDAGADALRAPALVGRQVDEVGAMPLAGVDDGIALGARRREQRLDRLDRRACQREVVAHGVDVAALAAKIGLHVDDDDGGVVWPPVAVPGPGVGVGVEGRQRRLLYFSRVTWPSTVRPACLAPNGSRSRSRS